jgi:hypothetical protein
VNGKKSTDKTDTQTTFNLRFEQGQSEFYFLYGMWGAMENNISENVRRNLINCHLSIVIVI